MATWIVHLRVADALIKSKTVPCEYKREFVLGSVAPDCGYGKKDSFGDFSPPPSVSHWAPSGIKFFCRHDEFYNEYLKDKEKNDDYYFYLGYYAHLLTDVLWSSSVYMTAKMKYKSEFEKNPSFIKVIKKDWSDLDFKFLQENPDFESYRILKSAGCVKDYLPYYEKGQLTKQTKFIADFYSDFKNHPTERDYKYLTAAEMDSFVEIMADLLKDIIK